MHEILCAREKLRIRQLAKKFTLELAIIAYHFPVCKNYIHQHPLMPHTGLRNACKAVIVNLMPNSRLLYGQTAGIQCACNALMAICWEKVRKFLCWRVCDLDHVLDIGMIFIKHWVYTDIQICQIRLHGRAISVTLINCICIIGRHQLVESFY